MKISRNSLSSNVSPVFTAYFFFGGERNGHLDGENEDFLSVFFFFCVEVPPLPLYVTPGAAGVVSWLF